MESTAPATSSPVAVELPATAAEVKRYEQQKLTVSVAALLLRVAVLGVLALLLGPRFDAVVRTWTGDSPWARVVVLGLGYAVLMELLLLPLSFYASFVLEHRYGLSTQTLAAWVWRRVKGYALAGVFGLAMTVGLYVLLWYTGPWWWLWATAAFLAVTLVLGRLL